LDNVFTAWLVMWVGGSVYDQEENKKWIQILTRSKNSGIFLSEYLFEKTDAPGQPRFQA
jgi:hypothetical protein